MSLGSEAAAAAVGKASGLETVKGDMGTATAKGGFEG